MTQEHTSSTPPDPAARLAAFEQTCERLWPFVRYFALAGACPDAIEAVADLAQLLGKSLADHATILAATKQSQRETITQIADWFEASSFSRAMLASMRTKFVHELRALAEQ